MAEGSESRKALGQEHLRTLVNREVSVVQVWSVREEGTEKRKGMGVGALWLENWLFPSQWSIRKL